jgi:hypothetical protein
MKKQFAIAIVAIMLLSVLVVPPVMSSGLRDEITLQSIKAESEITVDFPNETIDVGGKQLKLSEIEEISREDIIVEGIRSKVSINGQLGSGEYKQHNIWFAEGVEVFVEIYHSPQNVDVFLGIYDIWGSGTGGIDRDHDGYACFYYTIPENGDYYITVGAPDGGFSYTGWIHW